jgi:WD40 repeat protein
MTKNFGGAHMFIALSNGIIAYEQFNKIVLRDTKSDSMQTIEPPAHTLSQLVKQSATTFVAVAEPEKICLYSIDGTLIKDFELENHLYLTIKLTKNLIAGLCRTNSGGPQIQIWNTKKGVCKKTILTAWLFNLVKLSQKQKLLATCERLGDNISVWNWKTGACIRKFSATSNHHDPVHLTRLSDTVLATHSGKELKLWDYYSGTCLRTIPQDDHIWKIVVLPNKSLAIVLGGKIKILSLLNNQQKIFTAHENDVINYSLLLSNGQLLTASIDQYKSYWDENTEVKIWS